MPNSSNRQVPGGQVHLPRLAEVVADRIRNAVLEGELNDGDHLPRLEELTAQYGVSGPSMREALRILEAEGLIEVRRGSVGGSIVHRPDARMAAYTLALVLRSEGVPKGELADALSMVEPLCGVACAGLSNRKSTVVRELRSINARARALVDGDPEAFNETMNEFHTALVRGCGNEVLRLLTRALASVWRADMRKWMDDTVLHGSYPKAEKRLESVEAHEAITELIAAGDEVGVAAAMTEHNEVRRIYREGVDPSDPIDPLAVRRRR